MPRKTCPSTWLAVLASVGACATDDERSSSQALVTPTSPYRYDVPASAIPDLGTSGFAAVASPTATDVGSTHEGTFSNGRTSSRAGIASRTSWYPEAAGLSWPQFESAPAFTTDLDAAATAAEPALGGLSDGKLETLASILSAFPLPIIVHHPSPVDSFFGWEPVQARWLRSQYAVTSTTGAMTKELYPDPSFGGEIRERGARLYCAARAAQVAQNTSGQVSMGRQVALPISILGHEVDLGVVEATFTLDGPQKFTGSAGDGAQAFEIPMQIGTAITPIDGLGLPGFGELRHPLVLISGDTEVASALAPQWLHTGDVAFCGFFGCHYNPTYTLDAPKDYLTVTHADAARGRSGHLDVGVPETPLFTLGAFTVTISGSGSVDVGRGGVAAPQDDRLIAGAPSGWPASSRAGGTSLSPYGGYQYDEEAWSPTFSPDATVTDTQTFRLNKILGYQRFGASDPLLMRALEDDDHHLTTSTAIGLDVHVNGDFGFNLGIARLSLRGIGGVHVGASHDTDVRDGELALTRNGTSYPLTALTVTPSTSADASLSFQVTLNIHIPLPWPLDDIDETLTIIDATTGKTWTSAPWAQANRALIATGSSLGIPTTQPWAVSHLPSPATAPGYPVFNSFDEDVTTCLADAPVPSTAPPACPPSAGGTTPHGNLCVFSGSWLVNTDIGKGTPSSWDAACSDIPTHVDAILPAGTATQKQCYVAVLDALCRPASREQDWNGQHGVAHVIDMAAPDFDLDALATQCASAFYPLPAATTFNQIFELGACDADAQMLDPTKVVTPLAPTDGTPSAVTAGSCH